MSATGEAPVSTAARAIGTFATTVLTIALALANSVLLAQLLGPEGRGELAAAVLWPPMIAFFASMGFTPSVLYHAARPAAATDRVLGNALVASLIQSAIAVPICYWSLPWLLQSQDPEIVAAARLYTAVIPVSLASQYALALIQAKLQIGAFNRLRLIIPAGYLLGTIALASLDRLTLDAIVVLHVGLNVGVLLATLVTLRALRTTPGLGVDATLARSMVGYGVRVQAGDASQGLNLRLDQAMMAAWLPPADLGYYVVAVSAAMPAQALATTVRMIAVPTIASQEDADRPALLARVFRTYLVLSLLGVGLLALALPGLLTLVFGSAFLPALLPAEVLLAAALFLGAKDVLGGGAQAMGRPWLVSRAELLSLGVTVIALLALLPLLGVLGAAIASLLAYAAQVVLITAGLVRHTPLRLDDLFRIRRDDLAALTRFPEMARRLVRRAGGSAR